MKRKNSEAMVNNIDFFQLSAEDAEKFAESKKKLAAMPSSESTVLQMELILFDAIGTLRKYEHPKLAQLLEQLRMIQENEYQKVRYPKLTTKMRNTAIRTFKNAIRIVLTRAINKPLRKKLVPDTTMASAV